MKNCQWKTLKSGHKVLLKPDGIICGGNVPKSWQGKKLQDKPWESKGRSIKIPKPINVYVHALGGYIKLYQITDDIAIFAEQNLFSKTWNVIHLKQIHTTYKGGKVYEMETIDYIGRARTQKTAAKYAIMAQDYLEINNVNQLPARWILIGDTEIERRWEKF